MNYSQFSKTKKLINIILAKFGILISKTLIIKIDNEPDYEISEYKREIEADYYFYNSWNYKENFRFVIDISIIKTHILHFDNFKNISEEYNIPFYVGNECEFLLNALEKDSNVLESHGFGTDVDSFKIKKIRISTIDNIEGKVNYEGTFYGGSYEINPVDFAIYSIINVVGTPLDIDDKPFYNSLLAESFILLQQGNYKLSYFLLYSAFESFINYELGTADEQERLKDKLKKLFCIKFPNLSTHQIYTNTVKYFDQYTIDRNGIAHGKSPIKVDKKMVEESFTFVLTMISSYLTFTDKFDDLYNEVILEDLNN